MGRSEKGSVLLVTIGIILILSITLYSLATSSGTEYMAIQRISDSYQAQRNAKAGVGMALKEMRTNQTMELPFESTRYPFGGEEQSVRYTISRCYLVRTNGMTLITPGENPESILIQTLGSSGKTVKRRTVVFSRNSVIFSYYD